MIPEPIVKREIARRLLEAQRILISSHVGVDGDSAGSAVGLMIALERLGKEPYYLNAEPIPELLTGLPGFDRLLRPFDAESEVDLCVMLDTSSPDRIGRVWKIFEKSPRLVIDHHSGNGNASETAWLDETAASVTIMIGEILDEMKVPIDREIAFPLLVGLFTDTGSFEQSNTDPRAMRWGARFIECGVSPVSVAQPILEEKRLAAVRLSGRAAERARVEGKVAWSALLRSDYADLGAVEADVEGVIRNLRSIGGVRVTILFREQEENCVKATFRSKDKTDVAAIARHFGGGGHAAASGCTIHKGLANASKDVLARVHEVLGDL